MADATLDQLNNPYQEELMGLNRQRALANMLLQQNMQAPQGQMVSGRYVAPNPLQYLGNMAQIVSANQMASEADKEQMKLASQLRQGKAGVEEQIINKLSPQASQPGGIFGPNGQLTTQTTADMYGPNMELTQGYKNVAPIEARGPDYAGALRLAKTNPYGAGKEMIPEILKKQLGPEDTADYRNFLKVKAEYDAKGIPITFNQYQDMDANRKRPVTNVSVNTGQHGFDNALKLRSDFRSEPVYKGFEETKAAKNQIDQAAKMASPAGDLAAATKIMKILDPGSVVRESELGMAMAATGVEDRVRNYAQMVIDGTKLTPKQRTDFIDLSNKLYDASAEQFNQKRGEYKGIAERNKLDVEAAVGAPASIKGNQGWRIK
jgi:hypothetical protein